MHEQGILAAAFGKVMSGLDAIGSIWILLLVVLINSDAFGRTLFAAPIDGVVEIIELSLVGIVFLQLGDATRHGRLTRSDGFFNLVKQRSPLAGRAVSTVIDLLGALFMLIILWGSVPLLIESIEGGYFVGNEGVFTAPVWPVNLVIVIGCFMTFVQFLIFAWCACRPQRIAVTDPWPTEED